MSQQFDLRSSILNLRIFSHTPILPHSHTEKDIYLLGRALLGVVVCAQEVQRDVRLLAHHPTVVRCWRDVKEIAGVEFNDAAVVEGGRRGAGKHHAHVFYRAVGGSGT